MIDGYDVYAAAREEYRKKIAEQAAEIERLRNELSIAQNWSERVLSGQDEDAREIDRLCTEIKRIRTALEAILSNPRDANKSYPELFIELCHEIRAALNPAKD